MNWGCRLGSGGATDAVSEFNVLVFSRVSDDSSASMGRIDFMPVSKNGGIGAVILTELLRFAFAGGTYPSSGQLVRWLSGAHTGPELEIAPSAFKFGVKGTIGTRSVLITSRRSMRDSFQGTSVTFGSPTSRDSSLILLSKSVRNTGGTTAVSTVLGTSSFSLLHRLFGPDAEFDQDVGTVECTVCATVSGRGRYQYQVLNPAKIKTNQPTMRGCRRVSVETCGDGPLDFAKSSRFVFRAMEIGCVRVNRTVLVLSQPPCAMNTDQYELAS